VYQGFSLLTANADVIGYGEPDSLLTRTAQRLRATPAQVIFAFARAIGILPLTGTSSAQHMQQDLAALELQLSEEEVSELEMFAVR
jgi:aryl-alcohol dehydrogenase-like predicted oxidoreductase